MELYTYCATDDVVFVLGKLRGLEGGSDTNRVKWPNY